MLTKELLDKTISELQAYNPVTELEISTDSFANALKESEPPKGADILLSGMRIRENKILPKNIVVLIHRDGTKEVMSLNTGKRTEVPELEFIPHDPTHKIL